jgi:hypothetical protein
MSMPVVAVLRWWFGYFRKESREYAMGHSLLSTYKRRPPPPHFNNTSRKRATPQEHHSKGLRP